jgi:plasmid stabilization system protein ParE
MKLRFAPRATQDLLDIADYIRERNPNASLRVRAAILDSLHDLVLFPEAGRRQTIEGVRNNPEIFLPDLLCFGPKC